MWTYIKANHLSIKGMSTVYKDKSYHWQAGTVYSLPKCVGTVENKQIKDKNSRESMYALTILSTPQAKIAC